MDDLIGRQDAIVAIAHELDMIDHAPQWVSDRLVKALRGVPSAERKKGKWIMCTERCEEAVFAGSRCSECNYWKSMGIWNFCPNCGADMRERKEE